MIASDVIAKTQGARFVESKPMAHDDGHYRTATCYYRLAPDYQSVSLEVIGRSMKDTGSPRKLWKEKFDHTAEKEDSELREESSGKEERSEAAGAEHGKAPEHIEDLGDDAYWVDTGRDGALYVLKGEQIIRLSLGGRTPRDEKKTRAISLAKSALGAERASQ